MTHTEKVRLYEEVLRKDNPTARAPPLWHFLWRLGVEVPPPEFVNPLVLFLLVFALLVALMGSSLLLLGVATRTGMEAGVTVSALSSGFYYFSIARTRRRHGFSSWKEFGAQPTLQADAAAPRGLT